MDLKSFRVIYMLSSAVLSAVIRGLPQPLQANIAADTASFHIATIHSHPANVTRY
jgi:hypothetical protein